MILVNSNMKKKIFISYSHKDQDYMQRLVNHLKAFEIFGTLTVWNDECTKIGKEWEDAILNAIDESNIAILLMSKDFLISDFIRNKELPWLEKKYELNRMEIIPFVIRPSNWETYRFSQKLKVRPTDGKPLSTFGDVNDKIEEVLANFAKEINELYVDLDKKEKSDVANDNSELFCKAFVFYKLLDLYDENEEYSFKLTSDLLIYKNNEKSPEEIWKFVDEIQSIEEYAKIITKMHTTNPSANTYGVVQNNRLSSNLVEMSFFLKTIKAYLPNPTPNKVLENFLNQQDIRTLASIFSEGIDPVVKSSHLDSLSSFDILGYTNNELRAKIFNKITEKFKIKLTDDSGNTFALKPFLNVFENALKYMEINRGNIIDFHTLISKIDILKLPYDNKNNLDFMNGNSSLVEKNLSDNIAININKLYVESKAKYYYKNQYSSYEDIDNLSDWLKSQIYSQDFLILLGDFGHGKTTFLKHITAQLSDEYVDGKYIPIYLSLRQHFTKNGTLKDAVSNAVMPRNKMTDEFWNNNKWLIFCDGFDELSIYHHSEPNWITLVFSILLNESKKANIKIVLSSRPVLFLDPSIKKETVNNFDRLILKPFDESQIIQWLKNWSKYKKEITIKMIKERNLLQVSPTPVILFLIATIFHEELNDKSIKYTKSQIYKKFFDWTAKSGGLIENNESIKHKVPKNYREILQEIACQIFTHPDATSGMLHCEVLLKQLSQKFENVDLQEFLNQKIFVAHAFKESVPEHIEFIHQSLREYLVAEKIFNSYYKFCTTNFKDTPVYQFEYNQLILTKPISQAKLDFFKDILTSLSKKEKEKIQMLQLFKIDTGAIGECFIQNNNNNFFEIFSFFENEVINSNQHGILNIIIGNIVLLNFMFKTYCEAYVDISELKKVQNFFESNEEYSIFQKMIKKMFINFKFKHIKLYDINFDNFEFNNTIFAEAIFRGNSFNNTKISNSKFIPNKDAETVFMDCSFKKVILNNVKFNNVKFSNSTFIDIEEIRSTLFGDTEFKNCIFDSCLLSSFDYKNTKFIDCIFINCKFHDMQTKLIQIHFYHCIAKDENKWIDINSEKKGEYS